MPSVKLSNPDLTQHPPRSARVRLGGYTHLPRLLDKARASVAGKNGEYHFNCPMDRQFFDFTGIDHEALLAEVKLDRSDSEMIAWVRGKTKRLPSEIAAWSSWLDLHGPGAPEGHEWLAGLVKGDGAKERDDIRSFADLLDLDDYVTFGGKG